MERALADIVDQLTSALAGGPPLRLAVLFGSAARRRLRADSDLDVAILPVDPDLTLERELDLQRGLSLATGRPVDLVRLDRAPTLLRWQIARDGQLILAAPPTEWSRFRARAAAEHADLAPALRVAGERFRRHLTARGGEAPR